MTPPETVADLLDDLDPLASFKSTSSVPWPGSTFIIRSASSGQVLTLLDGQLVLASPGMFILPLSKSGGYGVGAQLTFCCTGGRGSIHWACVQTKGWLGFRNTVSGRFLGHDSKGKLCCSVDRHRSWENFCVRQTPEGGYVLLMTHFERLWHVGSIVDQGREKLAKIGEKMEDAIIWEFVKV